ncbi:protein tyrosine kinase [Ancylostoma ceylanicum]|uniref:Protein tyrosine kinase n=1 Tax=Ancylostoma ceylanicum TaxID=53326 RepID=A0A0D6L602_9BILA|nr:protein tyrosine kinase [Ancylostoma ceylanicum]
MLDGPLKTKLGEGAFGEVWKGTLRQSPTKTVEAAIKVTKLKEDNKKYMQEMYKEARLMRQYQHINVVGFYGMVMENDNVMIVMEMVNGGGLDHHLKKSNTSSCSLRRRLDQVAQALGDLACRNCLIDTEKNIVKISDFGLSKQADSYKIQANERIPTKWQAPEVVATHIYTRECDVYSYGILVWEIFNNAKMPFAEYDNKTVRARIFDPTFRPPLSDDLPDEIRVIVTACWAAQPNNRPVMKDVAWILKRFQKHNIPEQAIRKPAPPAPAAKPSPAQLPPVAPVAPPAIVAPVVIAKTTKLLPKDRRMASKPATPQAHASPGRKGFPDPRKDYSREEFVDYGQQADRAIIANVLQVSLLVQQHSPAGLPLAGYLAFRQMFGSNPIGNGRCTIPHRLDGMSDFGRENRRDDKSILPEMAWREVDMAVEELRVEVVDDILHYPSR